MNETSSNSNIGRVLDGRYALTKHLADGSMGSVWEARHLALETSVAVKLIREPRPDWVRRFRRESKVVAQLTSPYVVRVFDYGVDEGTPYFVMERLYGLTMADHLHQESNPLTPAVTARLVRQIANGLGEAHRRGIVHRDLKPQNIWLLEGAGGLVAKILDFGLATTTTSESEDADGTLSGTPRYMSPEQYDANAAVDHRSDLWAVGVIAYECLTGQQAYPQTSLSALMMAITQGAPLVPSRVAAVPDGFDGWFARAVHRDPAERFQSATEAAEALSVVCEAEHSTPRLSAPVDPNGTTAASIEPPMGATLPDLQQLRTNLVSLRSSFVGRETELHTLAQFLRGGKRLVSLLGPGGSGKTRLAREFGQSQLAEFPGGVWFVDLTEVTDLTGLQNTVAQSLEVPIGRGDPMARVGYAIAGRGPTLLIIDNFEQIVDQASQAIAKWSGMAPDAVFLITSRERLRIEGETVIDVEPQPRTDAIRLFEERARAVSPQFSVNSGNEGAVAEIVDRLDCLPLAVELAAARMRMLSLSQLSTRLAERFRLLRTRRRDQGARQSTMRGAIDWSWALLTTEERLLLVQLSVFRGGFDFEAVDAVVDLEALEDAGWPDEIVESLVEKSLIRSLETAGGQRRFYLLESIRAYAAEKLTTPDAVVPTLDNVQLRARGRSRHREHFGALGARNVASSLYIAGGADRRDTLRREQDNLEAAVITALEDGDGRRGAMTWLAQFWGVIEPRGPYRPAADAAMAILALGVPDVGLEARVQLGAGTAFRLCGDREAALEICTRALENAEAAQDFGLCSSIWRERGTVLLANGNLEKAGEDFERASQMARDHGLRRLEGISYGSHAEIFFWKGDIEGARKQYDASVTLLNAVGERRFFAGAVANRAVIDYELGDLASAMAGYKVALTFLRRIGYRRGESDLLSNMALVDHAEGRHTQAIREQEAALRIDREGGNRPGEALRLGNLGIFFAQLGRNTEAELKLNQSLALSDQTLSPLVGTVRVYLGLLAARRGDFTTAESELKSGENILEQTSQTELAKATCIRGEVAILAGDLEAADSARTAAHQVATHFAAAPRSELGRQLLALDTLIATAKDDLEI